MADKRSDRGETCKKQQDFEDIDGAISCGAGGQHSRHAAVSGKPCLPGDRRSAPKAAEPEARLEREGSTLAYRTEARLENRDAINDLMYEKYGWRDTYIDMLIGGRDDAVPVALIPTS